MIVLGFADKVGFGKRIKGNQPVVKRQRIRLVLMSNVKQRVSVIHCVSYVVATESNELHPLPGAVTDEVD